MTTTAASDAFGTLYVVRYEDGDEEELSYEELLPALVVDADERWSPVPRDVSEAAEKLSVWKVQTMNKGLGHGRRNFRGVCAADPPEAGFVAWVTDDAGEDHVFDFLFLTRWGAAAAHDLMLRRIQHGSGARKAQSYDPNFPNASWSDLCAVVLFAAANDARVVAKNVAPPTSETKRKRKKTLDDSEAVVDGALTTPAKRKKRSAKEPHRHVVGRRVYDSELGVTCHWCRQKTTDPRVRCVLKSCAESASSGRTAEPSSRIASPSPSAKAACATDTARTSTAPPRPTHGSARSAEVRAARDVAGAATAGRVAPPPAPRPRDNASARPGERGSITSTTTSSTSRPERRRRSSWTGRRRTGGGRGF